MLAGCRHWRAINLGFEPDPLQLELVEPRLKPRGAEALSHRLDQTVRFMADLVELAALRARGRP